MKIILLFFVLLTGLVVHSQKQANQWRFGQHSGLDFSTNPPTPVFSQSGSYTSAVDSAKNTPTQEGTASISDNSGKLLFYTDGVRVWNSNGKLMPNGNGLYGGFSSTVAAFIVPMPGNENIFYVFTTPEFQSFPDSPLITKRSMYYSIVNMCADSGRGDIQRKNIFLMDSSTEKISVCEDANSNGYWIVGHKLFTNLFYVWHLTSSGLSSPTIIPIGSIHGQDNFSGRAQGQMKFSPDGTMLAVTISNQEPAVLEIFKFSTATGVISSPMRLFAGNAGIEYGLEFSPDGKRLFTTINGGTPTDPGLYRYDITSGNINVINASRTKIAGDGVGFGLQLAPDGKIYNTNTDYSLLNVINSPNDDNVNFSLSAIQLTGTSNYTFPSFISGFKYHNTVPVCETRQPFQGGGSGGAPRIYPNPVINEQLTIDCAGDWKVRIIDATGRTLGFYSGTNTSNINLSFPNGFYIMTLFNKDLSTSFKFLIQK